VQTATNSSSAPATTAITGPPPILTPPAIWSRSCSTCSIG